MEENLWPFSKEQASLLPVEKDDGTDNAKRSLEGCALLSHTTHFVQPSPSFTVQTSSNLKIKSQFSASLKSLRSHFTSKLY